MAPDSKITSSEKEINSQNWFKKLLSYLLNMRELTILLVVIVMGIYLGFASPIFLTWGNIKALSMGIAFNGIVVVGMTILLVSGGFDLSVGSVAALSGVTTALLLINGFNVTLGIILGLGMGILIGLINGLLIAKVKVNALIVTLGMMSICRGLVFVLTRGYSISNLPEGFTKLAQNSLLGLQSPIWIFIFVILLTDIFMRRSAYMRQLYYIGGNEDSARLVGINVDKIRILTYISSAFLASLAGLLMASRLGAATVSAGKGMELEVISAAVIGGASLTGGEGSILGSFFGVLLMGLIVNGFNLLGISIYWQQLVVGLILVIAVTFDTVTRRQKHKV